MAKLIEHLKSAENKINDINSGAEIIVIGIGKGERKLFELSDFVESNKKIWNESFELLYNESLNLEYYHEFAPYALYTKHYEEKLKGFKNKFPDAREVDFLITEKFELQKWAAYLDYKFFDLPKNVLPPSNVYPKIRPIWDNHNLSFIDDGNKDKLVFSVRNKLEFIETRFEFVDIPQASSLKDFNVKWKGDDTELLELIKALKENGSLIGKQKDMFEAFFRFFDQDILNPDTKISTMINQRNNGSETLFIDKLKKAFYNYVIERTTKKGKK